jgi:tripartite-type tricarboxylate transporter receptor subunit TctC
MNPHPITRRLAAGALGLACTLVLGVASAQDWPGKPIRIVSPYAAGGVGDTIFRLLSPALEARLGQRFLIDNKTGAAGNIGAQEVVRAAPDGYTFLMAPTANYVVNQHLFKLDFNALTQLDPVTTIATAPLIAVVGAKVTATTLQQFATQSKVPGTKFNFGSPGAGSPTHLAGAYFALAQANGMEHIAYRGTPPMTQALLAGDIQLAFPTLTPVVGQLKAGTLKAVAVMASQRLAELPNVPTAAEAGFPDMLFGNWWTLAAPKGTDTRILNRLHQEIRTLLADPAIVAKLLEIGHVPMGLGPAESSAFMRTESAQFKSLIDRTGIRVD